MKSNLAETEYKSFLLGEQYINWFYSLRGRKPKWFPTYVNSEGKRMWARTRYYY